MKCELAAALLHRPTTLFLDEPTIGLDVAMQVAIRDFIRSYNQRHEATVLLTSHYMDDVVALCPRIIVIDARQADPRRRPAPARQDDGSRQARVVHAGHARSPTTSSRKLGTVLVRDGQRITLRVAERELPSVVGHLLGTLKAARPRDRGSAARGHPARDVRQVARSPRARRVRGRRVAHAARAADAVARRRRRDRRVPRRVPRVDADDDDAARHARRCGRASRDEAPFEGYTSAGVRRVLPGDADRAQPDRHWVAWQISEEIRMGTMSMRLLAADSPVRRVRGEPRSRRSRSARVIALPIAVDPARRRSGATALATDPLQLALIVAVDRDRVAAHVRDPVRDRRRSRSGSRRRWRSRTSTSALFTVLSGYLLPLDADAGLGRDDRRVAAVPLHAERAGRADHRPTDPRPRSPSCIGGQARVGRRRASRSRCAVWRAGVRRFEAVGG